MNQLQAKAPLTAGREVFTDLESWKAAVLKSGGKVRKTTVTNYNTYYQAVNDGVIFGFFNSQEGKKGANPDPAMKAGGSLDTQKPARYKKMGASAISEPQVDQLKDMGYEVEDMGKVYGPGFRSQYRWVKGQEFQDHDTSDSVGEAWNEAWIHHQRTHN